MENYQKQVYSEKNKKLRAYLEGEGGYTEIPTPYGTVYYKKFSPKQREEFRINAGPTEPIRRDYQSASYEAEKYAFENDLKKWLADTLEVDRIKFNDKAYYNLQKEIEEARIKDKQQASKGGMRRKTRKTRKARKGRKGTRRI